MALVAHRTGNISGFQCRMLRIRAAKLFFSSVAGDAFVVVRQRHLCVAALTAQTLDLMVLSNRGCISENRTGYTQQ